MLVTKPSPIRREIKEITERTLKINDYQKDATTSQLANVVKRREKLKKEKHQEAESGFGMLMISGRKKVMSKKRLFELCECAFPDVNL